MEKGNSGMEIGNSAFTRKKIFQIIKDLSIYQGLQDRLSSLPKGV